MTSLEELEDLQALQAPEGDDRTEKRGFENGGEGRRYAGSSVERGSEVEISMIALGSVKVFDIVTESLGFAGQPNLKSVLTILVRGSRGSITVALSTKLSQIPLTSAVCRTA